MTTSRRERRHASPSAANTPVTAGLVGDLIELAPAAVAVGAVAQDLVDRVEVGDDHHPARAEIDAEERAVAVAPALGDRVQAVGARLERVADQRPAARARAGRRSAGGHGCSVGVGRPGSGAVAISAASRRRSTRKRHIPIATSAGDEHGHPDQPDLLEDPLGGVADEVRQQPVRGRPHDPAERVPLQERRPGHPRDAGHPRRGDPQPGEEAPEEHRLRSRAWRRTARRRAAAIWRWLEERAVRRHQPAAEVPADREADVVADDRRQRREHDHRLDRVLALAGRRSRRRTAPSRRAAGCPIDSSMISRNIIGRPMLAATSMIEASTAPSIR